MQEWTHPTLHATLIRRSHAHADIEASLLFDLWQRFARHIRADHHCDHRDALGLGCYCSYPASYNAPSQPCRGGSFAHRLPREYNTASYRNFYEIQSRLVRIHSILYHNTRLARAQHISEEIFARGVGSCSRVTPRRSDFQGKFLHCFAADRYSPMPESDTATSKAHPARQVFEALPYSGPAPVQENPRVCIEPIFNVKSRNLDDTTVGATL